MCIRDSSVTGVGKAKEGRVISTAGVKPEMCIRDRSTNDVTIQEIHRTMDLEKLKAVVRRIQAPGNIHQHLDLIAGLPYEDLEEKS